MQLRIDEGVMNSLRRLLLITSAYSYYIESWQHSLVCRLRSVFSVINSSFKLFKCDLIVELCLISELKVGIYYLLCLN
jgi:hypothetical protein